MPRTIIDVHVLQTVPPSNVNRDDTGSPKTAVYGGVTRARVSSQAWKRVTRRAFEGLLAQHEIGVRTKRVADLVASRIEELSPQTPRAAAVAQAVAVLTAAGLKVDKPKRGKDAEQEDEQTAFLLFLSRRQVDQLAGLAVTSAASGVAPEKKAAKAAADTSHSIDLALFGRMVADAPDFNVDACAQVAHAISVHAAGTEFDYFTAVDDRAPADNAGAGMIGTVEFTSSTLYRYATVDVDALRSALAGTEGEQDATAAAVEAFLTAFVTSMPTGKQNTFAHRTLPDAVVVQVRERQPVNLVGAFEEAVPQGARGGYVGAAARQLALHSAEVDAAYGGAPVASYVLALGAAREPLAGLGEQVGLDDLVRAVGRQVRERAGVPA